MTADPSALARFRGLHAGSTIIVCGCGSSLRGFVPPPGSITIGVNDVGRQFEPDYLVVLNPRSQFSGDRFSYVERSRAKALFTQLELGVSHPRIVKCRLGKGAGPDWTEGDSLHHTRNSPYVALQLALYMGAGRVGIIGVDFTDHHFFGRTGRHPLNASLETINAEYSRVHELCRKRGIEVFNLSAESRLTAFPKASLDNWPKPASPPPTTPRIFFVHYEFLSCGDVFRTGLHDAAQEIGARAEGADWDDPALPAKVERFAPDLLFVVHGRRFTQKWGRRFAPWRSAVWLLDEPYEVDDTERISRVFDHVFVNDPATRGRHRNAHYLPAAFSPRLHRPASDVPRDYDIGFIGGTNLTRERYLQGFADAGLLSYVVGGPWSSAAIRKVSLSGNVAPSRTAELYQRTRIVLNIFRDKHHFNRMGVAPWSLNPRVYEALACGALVLSEYRPEAQAAFPEMPVFRSVAEAVQLARGLMAEPERVQALAGSCRARLAEHTYATRLQTVLDTTLSGSIGGISTMNVAVEVGAPNVAAHANGATAAGSPAEMFGGWDVCGPVRYEIDNDVLQLQKDSDPSAGSERGIFSTQRFTTINLAFEVWASPGSSFIAKIQQASATDQTADSYHFYSDDHVSYLARHNHILATLAFPRGAWTPVRMSSAEGVVTIAIGSGEPQRFRDRTLTAGFAFIGVKGGSVRVRNLKATDTMPLDDIAPAVNPGFDVLRTPTRSGRPTISIVTTVYDRAECLRQCIRSVRRLTFQDLEHIIVADAPPPQAAETLERVVASEADGRIQFLNLHHRSNNWGITPAAVGLRRSTGDFVCFLSDDNGYTPDHASNLLQAFRREPRIGFAYSSCAYAGRCVLRRRIPHPGAIDLGQPMFRRELFPRYLNDDLPFNEFAWDWALINTFMRRGVPWRHVDKPTFIFRLAHYPDLVAR